MRVRVQSSTVGPALLAVARALGVTPRDAKALLATPRVLPAQLTPEQARALVAALAQHGVEAAEVDAPPTTLRCAGHPTLTGDGACGECRAPTCALCGERCVACEAKRRARERWKWRRVAVLLGVFAAVAFGAGLKTRRLLKRSDWGRPVVVSVVLASERPVGAEVQRAWSDGLEQLDGWFAGQARRHGLALEAPVHFVLEPEVKSETLAPPPATTGSWWEDTQRALAYRREVARLASPRGDVHLVVVLGEDDVTNARVEGLGERGGEYGVVLASAQDTQLTLELMATAHEALHCLGALDGYDADGHAVVPEGLVAPEAGYPQAQAEVMVGEVPLAPTEGRLPRSLDEVAIGGATARDIGWLK